MGQVLSHHDAIERILDLILRSQTPIEQISFRELCGALGPKFSIQAVRGALALLQRDGILLPAPNDVYVINYLTCTEAREVLMLRTETQKLVVERLAAKEPGERLCHAKEVLGLLSRCLHDGVEFLKLESRFWSELAGIGGFLTAGHVIASRSDQLRVSRATRPLERDEAEVICKILTRIVEKIEQHDASAAAEALDALTALLRTGSGEP